MPDFENMSDIQLFKIASGGDPDKAIDLASQAHDVPTDLIKSLQQQESGGKQSARSPKGAIGRMQLMPGTAKSLGVNPEDELENIWGGVKYLSDQLKEFGGDKKLALAAYNAGPGAVKKHGGVPPYKETQSYVEKVLGALGPSAAHAEELPTSKDLEKLSNEELAKIAGVEIPGTTMAAKTAALEGPPKGLCKGSNCGDMVANDLNPKLEAAGLPKLETGGLAIDAPARMADATGSKLYRHKDTPFTADTLASMPDDTFMVAGSGGEDSHAQKIGVNPETGERGVISWNKSRGSYWESFEEAARKIENGKWSNWTATAPLHGREELAGKVAAGRDLDSMSNEELARLAGVTLPKRPPEGEFKIGAKEGLLRMGQAGARAADPRLVAAMQAGLGYMPGLFGEYDDLPASSDQRVQSVTKTLMGELFPQGVPPEKQGYVDWIPRRLVSMWPEFMTIAALGPVGEVAAGAVDSALLSHVLGGAIPFGVTGALMSEKGPVAGGLESAIFGGILGAGKFATDFIPNALAKWTARIAGGFGLGAGSAAIEGADAEEMKKQGLLFALFEAFGIPKGKQAEAAARLPEVFKDALMEIAEKTEAVNRGFEERSYPTTVIPGEVDVTVGRGKGAKTVERAAPVEAFPEEEKLSPARMDWIVSAAARERQLEIDRVEWENAQAKVQPWSETVGETEIRKAQEANKIKVEEAAALQAKLDTLRRDYERDQMPGWKTLPPDEVEAEVSDMIRRYRDGSDEPIMTEVVPPDVLEKVREGARLPADYERRIVRALSEGSFPEYGLRKQWEQYLESQQKHIDNLATQTAWAEEEGVVPMYSIGPAPEAGPISNNQIMSARDEVSKRYDIPKNALAYKGIMRGKGNTALAMFDVTDPNNPRYKSTLSAQLEKAPIWNSKLEKVLDSKLPGKGSGQALANLIDTWANKGEFKREELKWSGLVPWLQEQKGLVTKQQIKDYLNSPEHRIEIEEVWKGVTPEGPVATQAEADRFVELDQIRQAGERGLTQSESNEYRELYNRIQRSPGATTKFSQYTLPGGENYRELLLRMPTGGEEFRSSHWEEPNVFSHIRVNDRRGPNGEKILFIEELQSDWALEGRKKGFRGDREQRERLSKVYDEIERLRALRDEGGYDPNDPKTIKAESDLHEMQRERIRLEDSLREGVPSFPFSRNWHEVAMKRMLRYAAENGYDEIAWTTGEQQFQRWGSERIDWRKIDDGWFVNATEQHGGHAGGIDIEAEARARGELLEGALVVKSKDQLRGIISEVMAREHDEARIDKLTDRVWNKMQSEKEGTSLPRKEWLQRLYDEMFGSFLNKYGKQWGARVGETSILTGSERVISLDTETLGQMIDRPRENVHNLSLTPSLKQSVLYEGQPMFLASDGKPVRQVVNEGSIQDAFGGDVTVKRLPDGDFLALTPGGAAIRVHPNADIVIDPHQFAIAYQRPYAGEKAYAEWDPRKGRWENITYDGLINLAKEGFTGDLDHEVFHAAMDLALTPEEQRLVLDKYGSEEAAASAYSKWKPSEAEVKSLSL